MGSGIEKYIIISTYMVDEQGSRLVKEFEVD
jgi:hypothetical protein